MGKSKANYAITGLSGKVGKIFVYRQRGGETIVATPPVRTAPPTPKQIQQQTKFAQAAAYARNALLDPTLKEAYTTEAKKRRNVSPYNMAMTDFLRPPQITKVDHSAYTGDTSDQKIIIEVADAFKVVSVKVKITAANNSTLEEGSATLVKGKWEYTTTANNATLTGTKITLTATDRPGNTTTKEITL